MLCILSMLYDILIILYDILNILYNNLKLLYDIWPGDIYCLRIIRVCCVSDYNYVNSISGPYSQ